MPTLKFSQVDVFAAEPFKGNPVAVVHDADLLSSEQMARFARWTNLSETTFLLSPRDANADYRLRIFTPGGELPFAGHPTLGSCHAWLQAGGVGADEGCIVQQCAVGLIPLRRSSVGLAFAAPPLRKKGPLDDELLARLSAACGLRDEHIVGHQWVDNGPGWCALLLDSADRVLSVEPDLVLLGDSALGLVGPHASGSKTDFELRAFVPSQGVPEDPVTGSLNASVAQWLIASGIAPARYIASQGARLGRAGQIFVDSDGDDVWVGGATQECITGTATF